MPDISEAKRTYDQMRAILLRTAADDTTAPECVLNTARLYREAWNDLVEAASAAGYDTRSAPEWFIFDPHAQAADRASRRPA